MRVGAAAAMAVMMASTASLMGGAVLMDRADRRPRPAPEPRSIDGNISGQDLIRMREKNARRKRRR